MMLATFAALTLASACGTTGTPIATPAKVAVEWNDAVLQIAEAEDGFLTLKGVRTAAMMHVAMHDALSSIDSAFDTYAYSATAENADPVAAASQAAFAVVRSQYPDQTMSLETLNNRWLETISDAATRTAGISLGKESAAAIMRARQGDGWDTEAEYLWHPMAPGVYAEFHEHSGTPQGFIFGAGWAKARGFALQSPDQFRSAPPPDIGGKDYARAFDEVKDVGRHQSDSRTADQTHMALWWKDFAESSHNRLARDLVIREGLTLQDSNRLFALLNMSIFDAYISSFDNKFFYNHWRPYTAIRWAANDGNNLTSPELSWTNTHQHTYAFPSYPSAHGTACAAAMSAFAHVLGDDYIFTMQTTHVDVAGPFSGKMPMQPAERHFQSFSDAAMECALSRIYLGIHFRYDSTAGFQLGQFVGDQVVNELLTAK